MSNKLKHESSEEEDDFDVDDLDETTNTRNIKDSHDDFDEFEDDVASEEEKMDKYKGDETPSPEKKPTKTTVVQNQPFDEVYHASDNDSTEDISSTSVTPQKPTVTTVQQPQPGSIPQPVNATQVITGQRTTVSGMNLDEKTKRESKKMDEEDEEEEDEEEEEEDTDETDSDEEQKPREYDPSNYARLPVTREIKELFSFIQAFKPQEIDLETKLKPFIPEYIPSVGDIDPFLKIGRPDGKPDGLGLTVLDEPSIKQSDPHVVKLDLIYRSKDLQSKRVHVKSIEQAHKNPKLIQAWIDDLSKLHKKNPPQNIKYSKPMPDIETLMKVWQEDYEELLQTIELPSAELDLDLEQYIKIVCALLDIPVYENLTESLHVLFTLYSEFKSNQHFNQEM